MVHLYPSENLNAWNLLSVRHFVYKLLFHVHLPRFGDIHICLSIVVKHRSKFFIVGIQIHIWIGSAYHESIRKVPWRTRNNFRILNRSCILILYRHYLKIVGNNKLWPDMQKESWNNHLAKILIFSHTLNGTDS
jgi:hypothetical protein